MLYICDIDGTLAFHEGIRSPYDESKVHLDKPLPTCQVINSLLQDNHVIFFSGRTQGCEWSTLRWLEANIPYFKASSQEPELYMRKVGDSRADTIIKKELYDQYLLDHPTAKIAAVFDDRLSVIKMWESLGLFVFNCNQGLKEF